MHIQWFPGHMAKAGRIISENLKLVDIVVELMDARIPMSSRNPEFDKLLGQKKRILILTKTDLADQSVSESWKKHFEAKGIPCLFINAKNKKDALAIEKTAVAAFNERTERYKAKGRLAPTVKTMIVGIPNVGKSTLINTLSGRAAAATGDKPGITRGKQWIRIGTKLDLLDTPGILWPKFEDPRVGTRLAFTGAIKDDVTDTSQLAIEFLLLMAERYPQRIIERYGIEIDTSNGGLNMLEAVGKRRGCVISGGNIDYAKAASVILYDFRNGKLGTVTLDRPEDEEYQSEIKGEKL